MTKLTFRKVLVCGAAPRKNPPKPGWEDRDMIEEKLRALKDKWAPASMMVIHGNAPGADKLAQQVAFIIGVSQHGYPANWTKYGNAAGMIRNGVMLDENPEIELVLAFHDKLYESKGTKDMLHRAILRGIPTIVYQHDDESGVHAMAWPPVKEPQ
jgi:YspA, cpYpsA-related SLOG family